ncbi:MAG: mandelate racemase/muconate lactonizing enzyme family protein [Verrucomicrobiales bacterium]
MIRALTATSLHIPFKQSFKHASAGRCATQSVWVEVELGNGVCGFGEGCPREYVTGESVASALKFICRLEPELHGIAGVSDLKAWVDSHAELIDANPAAWCAVELALLDALARETAQSVEQMLALPPVRGSFQYSAVLGAEAPEMFGKQLQRCLQMGFRDFKVKLSGADEDLERVALLKSAPASIGTLRFDANNLWQTPGEALGHLQRLNAPAFAIEEPLAAGNYQGAREIASASGLKIILDESLLRIEQLDQLQSNPDIFIVNLRISKMGGLLRSLKLARRACALGLPLIIGCQVGETSLLTRVALSVAGSLAGDALIAQEGAFGTLLLTHDIVERPLMFGHGGLLDVTPYDFGSAHGFGIDPMPHIESHS